MHKGKHNSALLDLVRTEKKLKVKTNIFLAAYCCVNIPLPTSSAWLVILSVLPNVRATVKQNNEFTV